MKKNYVLAMLIVLCNFAMAQQFITPTSYRGAFAPAPAAMWTDSWTNFDPQNTVYPTSTVNVTSEITVDTHWTAANVYKLAAQIYVKAGATLTIDPGTIILGDHTAVGAGLFITKGSKIIANGTASQPIVFTSDNAPGSRNKGDWGGIVLLGKGAFNINGGVNNIEGIAPSADTQYGGGATPVLNDNSGSMKYVRIEYGGYVLSPNNEINGLTMGAVGSGTVIDHIQVSFTNDDAFEWFGGSVNCSHLVSFRNLDDDFDTDNGYNGKVQFCLSVRDPQISDAPAVSTSEGFESDNNPTSAAGTSFTSAIFSNCTMVGPYYRVTLPSGGTIASGYKRAARIRRNSQLKIYNSVFMDYLEGVHIDGVTTETNALNGTLQFRDNLLAGIITSAKVLQVNSPGTITAGLNPSFNMTTWFAASGCTSQTSNAGLLTNPYNLANAQTYTGLDYRPASASPLLNSAHFTEAAISAVTILTAPEVTNISYCKSSVASPLTATLLGAGVSLKWYTVATGGIGTATAPTPLTTTVGVKNYWVSQVNASNVESPRAVLTVTTNDLPLAPATLTGLAAQSINIGTTNPVTYACATVVGATSYQWTVPAGVNLISGQGTTTVVVDFAGVTAGAGAIGNLGVKSVNANGCLSVLKTLALTKALPATPTTLIMTNGITTTPVTVINQFVGTTTEFTLTATSITATSYQWNLPSGVNQTSGGTSNVITVNFAGVASGVGTVAVSVNGVNGVGVSAAAKILNLTKALPATPTALVMTNGVTTTAVTNISMFVGTTTEFTLTATSITANSFEWTLPEGVNQISGGNTNIITVNFAGVPSGVGAVNISVKGVTGVGVSAVPKILALAKTLPATPSSLVMTNGVTTTAISNISPFVGTTTVFTLKAISTTANSFQWILPAGVNQLSGGNSDTITVNFADVASGVGTVIIGVNGVTGVGVSAIAKTLTLTKALPATPTVLSLSATLGGRSITDVSTAIGTSNVYYLKAAGVGALSYQWNLPAGVNQLSGGTSDAITVDFAGVAPGITSVVISVNSVNGVGVSAAAKLLTLTRKLPTAVAYVTGQLTGICGNESIAYTITAPTYTNSYLVTGPTDSVVTSASNPSNTSNVLATSDLVFTVTYPSTYTTSAVKTIVVYSVNGNGNSLTAKTLVTTPVMAAIVSIGGATTFTRCGNQTFTTPTAVGATSYNWVVANGAVIVSGQGTTSIDVDFSAVPLATLATTVKVASVNSCNVSSALKSLALTSASCARNSIDNDLVFTVAELYPNPATEDFNLNIDSSSSANLLISIYSINGSLVSEKNVSVEAGNNVINQNVSILTEGIYLVKITNNATSEVIVKKMIKK